jgi:hypothetical protein
VYSAASATTETTRYDGIITTAKEAEQPSADSKENKCYAMEIRVSTKTGSNVKLQAVGVHSLPK